MQLGLWHQAVEKSYELTAVISTLLTFFVFIAFAVFSIPGGTFAGRIGKKNLLLLGLGLNIVAMAIPTFVDPGFVLLLVCIFFLGIGTTFLQVAGNPIMRDVSEKGKYSKNLALAQGIKGIGFIRFVILGRLGAHTSYFCRHGLERSFPGVFAINDIGILICDSSKGGRN